MSRMMTDQTNIAGSSEYAARKAAERAARFADAGAGQVASEYATLKVAERQAKYGLASSPVIIPGMTNDNAGVNVAMPAGGGYPYAQEQVVNLTPQGTGFFPEVVRGLDRGINVAGSQIGGAQALLGNFVPGQLGDDMIRYGEQYAREQQMRRDRNAPTTTMAGNIAESVPGLVGAIGAGVATGGIAPALGVGAGLAGIGVGAGVAGAQAGGGQYIEGLDRMQARGIGADQARDAAANSGLATGAVSAATSVVPMGRYLSRFIPMPLATKSLQRLASTRMGRIAIDAAAEGSQEAAEEVASMVAQDLAENDPNAYEQFGQRLGGAFVAGGVLGGAVGAGAEVAGAAQRAALSRNKAATKPQVAPNSPETPDSSPLTPEISGVTPDVTPPPTAPNVADATPDVARTTKVQARIEFLFDELTNRPNMPDAERNAMEAEYAQLTGDPEYEAPEAQAAPTGEVGDPAADQIGRVAGAANNDATLRPVDQGLAGVVAPNGVEAAAQSRNVDGGADQVPASRMAQPADVKPGTVRLYHGGNAGAAKGGVWFTSSLQDAQGWASRQPGMSVEYVDVPESLVAAETGFATLADARANGVVPSGRIQLSDEYASQRRPLNGARNADVMAASVADMRGAELRARARELGVDDRGAISVVRRRVDMAHAGTNANQAPSLPQPTAAVDTQPSPLPRSSTIPAAPSETQSSRSVQTPPVDEVGAASSQNPTPTFYNASDMREDAIVGFKYPKGGYRGDVVDENDTNIGQLVRTGKDEFRVVRVADYSGKPVAAIPGTFSGKDFQKTGTTRLSANSVETRWRLKRPATPTPAPASPAPSAPVPPTPAQAPSPAQSARPATSQQSPTQGESATAATGTVSAGRALDGNRSTDDADLADIQRRTRGSVTVTQPANEKQKRITTRMGKIGRRVVWVKDSSKTFNGAASPRDSRTIFISVDISEKDLHATIAHELLHGVAKETPDIVRRVVQQVGQGRLAQAVKKYRGRLAGSFNEDSDAVKAFDANEESQTEEGVAQVVEDAADGDLEIARLLEEDPGLIGAFKAAVRQYMIRAGFQVGNAESRAVMDVFDRAGINGKAAQSRAVDWANTRAGITAEMRRAAADDSVRGKTRMTIADEIESNPDKYQGMAGSPFAFSGALPLADIKAGIATFPPDVQRAVLKIFRPNVRGGVGSDVMAEFGERYFLEAAALAVGESRAKRLKAVDAAASMQDLKKDPDPNNQLKAAIWQTLENFKGKPVAKVGIPAQGLRMGDVFRINGQAVRLVQDEDGNPVLIGGPFKGIDPRGLDVIPVDAPGVWTEDSKQALPIIAELTMEDSQRSRGVGAEGPNLSADVPFSPRGLPLSQDAEVSRIQAEVDAENAADAANDSTEFRRLDQLSRAANNRRRRVVDSIRAKITVDGGAVKVGNTVYVLSRDTYPASKGWRVSIFKPDRVGKMQAWGHSEHRKLDDPRSSGPYHSGAVQEVASYHASKPESVESIRFSPRSQLPATIEVDGKQRPTTNSNGQPIHPTQEGVRAFWKWFGESKVVDDQGRPRVVYHGSPSAGFDKFDKYQSPWRVPGFFSTSADYSSTYARGSRYSSSSGEAAPGVYAVYLKIENPIDMRGVDSDRFKETIPDEVWDKMTYEQKKSAQRLDESMGGGSPWPAVSLMRQVATTAGFDGVMWKEGGATDESARSYKDKYHTATAFVPIEESQIKSATGNTGTFDATNPDIRFSPGRSMFDRTDETKGTSSQQASLFAIPAQARATEAPKLTLAERRELYPGIKPNETTAQYEKRMGTADTPMMFAPLAPTIDVDGVQRPTTNSDGKQIAQDEASARNFWRWFKKSKAVDADGRPIAMYHGTPAVITEFDSAKSGKYNAITSDARVAGYFTDDATVAGLYSGKGKQEGNANVLQVYLKTERPLTIKGTDTTGTVSAPQIRKILAAMSSRGHARAADYLRRAGNSAMDVLVALKETRDASTGGADMVNVLRDAGYDSIVLQMGSTFGQNKNVDDLARHGVSVTFDATQTKSATGNLGTFDPANPDIRFAPGRGMSRIEARNQERADRKIGSLETKVETAAQKAESAKAAARATISVLQTQLKAAGTREKGLSKVVGILETMRARQEMRADEATAENQARAEAMKTMRATQRQIEQIKDAVVRAVRDSLPVALHGKFITDIRNVKSASQLPAVLAKIEQASQLNRAKELDKKLSNLTGVRDTRKLDNPKVRDYVVGARGKNGALKALTDSANTRDVAKKAMRDFVESAKAFMDAKTASQRHMHIVEMENAFGNLAAAVEAQKAEDKLVEKNRMRAISDVANRVVERLASMPVSVIVRMTGEKFGNIANHGILWVTGLDNIGNMIDGLRTDIGGGAFSQNIVRPIQEGQNQSARQVKRAKDMADDMARARGLGSFAEAFATLFGAMGDANTATYKLTIPIGGKTELRAWEALKLAALDQETLGHVIGLDRPLFWDADGSGFTVSWQQYDALMKAIPDNHLAFVQDLKAIRDLGFDAMASEVKKLTGTEPPKVFGYDKITVHPDVSAKWNVDKNASLLPTGHITQSLENLGITKARESNKAAMLVTNFGEDWLQTVDTQARVTHLAAPIRNMKELLRRDDVKLAIKSRITPYALERLQTIADDVGGTGTRGGREGSEFTRRLLKYSSNKNKALTAMNLASVARNGAGVMTLLAEMDVRVWTEGIARVMSLRSDSLVDLMDKSDLVSRFYGQSVVALQTIQTQGSMAADAGRDRAGTAWEQFVRGGKATGKSAARAAADLRGLRIPGRRVGAVADFFRGLLDAAGNAGTMLDGINMIHYVSSLPARVAWEGYKAEAARRGESEDWAIQQTERAVGRTQAVPDPAELTALQSFARGTPLQPLTSFGTDAARMVNMILRAKITGNRRGATAAAVVLAGAWSGAVTGLFSKEFLKVLFGTDDEEDRRNLWQKIAADAVRDSFGSVIPGVSDRGVEAVKAWLTVRTPGAAESQLLETPVSSGITNFAGGIGLLVSAVDEAIEGDDKKGRTPNEKALKSAEMMLTEMLEASGVPLPSVYRQGKRVVTAAQEKP